MSLRGVLELYSVMSFGLLHSSLLASSCMCIYVGFGLLIIQVAILNSLNSIRSGLIPAVPNGPTDRCQSKGEESGFIR